jgi:hypothetical protein
MSDHRGRGPFNLSQNNINLFHEKIFMKNMIDPKEGRSIQPS